MAKAHFIALETLLEEPENQVLGFTHICDITGIQTAHITNWNPTDFSRILKWGEQSWPARHKSVHCVNVPHAVKFVLDFAKSKVSSKMKERFQVHCSNNELHKKVEKACLPKELGGTIPYADMIASWHAEMASKRDVLLALDNMKLLNDQGIIRRNDKNNNSNTINPMQTQLESIAGSFRKLEVDWKSAHLLRKSKSFRTIPIQRTFVISGRWHRVCGARRNAIDHRNAYFFLMLVFL